MNVSESQAFLRDFRHDVQVETDPGLQAWYQQEFELQPEYVSAVQTQESLGRLAAGLHWLVGLKIEEAATHVTPLDQETVPSQDDTAAERPVIFSNEELLQKKLQKKYDGCLQRHEAGLDKLRASPLKSSKRAFQERLLRREFIRTITDLSDVTGDDHLVQRADLLDWTCTAVIKDKATASEVFADCADYAAKHGADVTSRPENLASLIQGSLPGGTNAKNYDSILASVFSSGHNQADFSLIHIHLGDAAFLLLEDYAAIQKVVDIHRLEVPYMTSAYSYENTRAQVQALLDGDLQKFIDHDQLDAVFEALRHDILGQDLDVNPKMARADESTRELILLEQQRLKRKQSLDDMDSFRLQMVNRLLTTGFSFSDQVAVTDLRSGQRKLTDVAATEPLFVPFIARSNQLHKRMKYIAPYTYAIGTAKKLLGPGVDGFSAPISPSLTVDIFTPMNGSHTAPLPDFQERISRQLLERLPAILGAASAREESGISTFEASGTLGLAVLPLYANLEQGVIIIRPAVPNDTKGDATIQQLMLAHYEDRTADEQANRLPPTTEALSEENEALRTAIRQTYKRFLGRRPVKFVLPTEQPDNALKSISLRFDARAGVIRSAFELADGTVELAMDRDFRILMPGNDSPDSILEVQQHYENLVLRSAQAWMCRQEVRTSEGIISDTDGNAANMGHFSYLRLLPGGRKASYSQEQRSICRQEQGRDLRFESERLAGLDPSGQGRNSTYVREYYDPSKPPLIVYPS